MDIPPIPYAPKLVALVTARLVLGSFVVAGLARFRRALGNVYGSTAATWFAVLCCVQFHLPFYASRPLPNTFALALTSWALGNWLEGTRAYLVVFLLAFTSTVVRCDVLLLAAPIGIEMLASGSLGLLEGILVGLVSVTSSVGLSLLIDSHFWGRTLWPEGQVLFFNTVENRSHEWGTSPFHWYATSALPRALGAAFLFALLGALLYLTKRMYWRLVAPAAVFVIAYSFLPHKELRFLFPVLPLLNGAAAVVLSRYAFTIHKCFTFIQVSM